MSESALPLPGGPVGAPAEDAEPDSKRRLLLLVGGAAALLVLVAAAYFLFLSGGSGSDNASGPVVRRAARPAAAASKAPAAVTKTVPQTFNNALSRDPFKPLVVPPPPAPAASAVGTTTTATSTTTASTTNTSATASSASTPVTLVKVYQKNGKTYATTKVGSSTFSPAVGQTFGGTFQLLSVNGTAATYVQGDEQFSLSVGQVVLK